MMILPESTPWSIEGFQELIDNVFLNDMKASEISIKDLDCSSAAANELLDMLSSISMNDTGLRSLIISCPSSFEELDHSVLDRLA